MKHRIIFILLILPILLVALSVNVFAEVTAEILEQLGSLTLQMNYDGKPLNDGQLNIYRVGDIENIEHDQYKFVPVEELSSYRFDFSDLTDQKMTSDLLETAKKEISVLRTGQIENGQAVFKELETGLYLVWQNKENVTSGFQPIQPFLISVPRGEGDKLLLDVVCAPKVPLVPTPPPPENPPPPPRLPQTGQLKWPVPVMAILGSALFITGFTLCVGRKRNGNEA